jgi:hypothetical protein
MQSFNQFVHTSTVLIMMIMIREIDNKEEDDINVNTKKKK